MLCVFDLEAYFLADVTSFRCLPYQFRYGRWARGGGGGATPQFCTPTTPPFNCWPEAPWGGGGVGSGRGDRGGGGLGGAWGVQVRQLGVGWGPGGAIWGVGRGGGGTGSPYLPLPSL